MADIALIEPKHGLATDVRHHEIKAKIVQRISEMGLQQPKYKMDTNLLNLLCELTEFLVSKDTGVSKKELVLEVISDLYGITDDERQALGNTIEFLHKNKLIRRVSMYRLFKTTVKEFFFAKKK